MMGISRESIVNNVYRFLLIVLAITNIENVNAEPKKNSVSLIASGDVKGAGSSVTKSESVDIIINNVRVVSPPNLILESATVVINSGKLQYVGAEELEVKAKKDSGWTWSNTDSGPY
jgi:hypothetical protein